MSTATTANLRSSGAPAAISDDVPAAPREWPLTLLLTAAVFAPPVGCLLGVLVTAPFYRLNVTLDAVNIGFWTLLSVLACGLPTFLLCMLAGNELQRRQPERPLRLVATRGSWVWLLPFLLIDVGCALNALWWRE